MASDINNSNNNTEYLKQGYTVPAETRTVKVDENAVKRTLKNIAAPVFDFFTKPAEEEPVEVAFKDYEKEIDNYNLKYAVTQKIMNDSDPTANKKINIVI